MSCIPYTVWRVILIGVPCAHGQSGRFAAAAPAHPARGGQVRADCSVAEGCDMLNSRKLPHVRPIAERNRGSDRERERDRGSRIGSAFSDLALGGAFRFRLFVRGYLILDLNCVVTSAGGTL